MTNPIRTSLLAILAVILLAAPIHAATFIVPPDEKLIDDSQAIVFATVVNAAPRFTELGEIETVYTLAIEDVLKGTLDSTQTTVVEWGGVIGDRGMAMSGAPRYELGKQYLIFMTGNRNGEWTTQHLTLGRFESIQTEKGELLVRDTSEVHDIYGKSAVEIERNADTFRAFVRDRVREHRNEANVTTGVAPNFSGYDIANASEVGAGVWVDDAGSNVAYSISGSPASANLKNVFDNEERIIEEDPNNDIAGAFGGSGVVATAFWGFNAPSHNFEGHSFSTITGSDVITQNGLRDSNLSQSTLRSVMAHELGHTLGFRHSNQNCPAGAPCTSQAIMNSSVGPSNGVLQQYDIDAVRAVYGNGGDATHFVNGRRTNTAVSFRIARLGGGSSCSAPTITAQPQNRNVLVGTTTSLSVTAGGTSPFTYQWFYGDSPNTASPVQGATSSAISITPTSAGTGKYWVRVSNSCTSGLPANSVTATVTATPPPCTLPSITSQPVDKTVNFNQTAALSIGVSAGASVTWYRGFLGDTSAQIGTGTAVNTPALTATTRFWARVSNTCGPISSRQVTVTVNQLTEVVPMLNGRFYVQVAYTNQFDHNKKGKLLGRSLFNSALSDTAIFTFGDPLVVELMVRLSDARPYENKIHLYLGGLSDVEFSVVVTDSKTGTVKEYRKPANQLVGAIDRASFPGSFSLQDGVDSLMVKTAALKIAPTAETSTIRLLNNRFEVRMRYRNQFTNPAGQGYMNARSIASSSTTETAVFYFDANVGSGEWMVRFSDARPFANRIDLFHGGLSDVEFTIEVLDTKTGVRKEYKKAPSSLLGQVDRVSYKP